MKVNSKSPVQNCSREVYEDLREGAFLIPHMREEA